METDEFYRKYANLPFNERHIPLDFGETEMTNMSDVCKIIGDLDNEIRWKKQKQKDWLLIAEKGFRNLKENN